MKEQELILLDVEKQLKKDQIVKCSSNLVKDCDFDNKSGMTEVAFRFMTELNQLLFELDEIESELPTHARCDGLGFGLHR